MNLGHGHRRSVLILWTWTALLSAFVLYPVLTNENPTYLPFGIGALAIVLFTVFHPSVRRRNGLPSSGGAHDRPELSAMHVDVSPVGTTAPSASSADHDVRRSCAGCAALG